jgi:hypothetical protein
MEFKAAEAMGLEVAFRVRKVLPESLSPEIKETCFITMV